MLHAEFSAMDYTLNIVSKCRFFFIFKHLWAPKRSWKIFHGGPGKVLDFFVSKRVGTLSSGGGGGGGGDCSSSSVVVVVVVGAALNIRFAYGSGRIPANIPTF